MKTDEFTLHRMGTYLPKWCHGVEACRLCPVCWSIPRRTAHPAWCAAIGCRSCRSKTWSRRSWCSRSGWASSAVIAIYCKALLLNLPIYCPHRFVQHIFYPPIRRHFVASWVHLRLPFLLFCELRVLIEHHAYNWHHLVHYFQNTVEFVLKYFQWCLHYEHGYSTGRSLSSVSVTTFVHV